MRKERESKKKQEALTLEETKAEIANAEAKLAQLKEEKHQLFHTLKKVLYEDDRRRTKEMSASGAGGGGAGGSGGGAAMYLQTGARPGGGGGGGAAAHYMKPGPHLLMGTAHHQQHQQQQQQQQHQTAVQTHTPMQLPQKRHRYMWYYNKRNDCLSCAPIQYT